jgi:transposase
MAYVVEVRAVGSTPIREPCAHAERNAIERKICRPKDFRRVATRYDRNAPNFVAAVCIAAAVSYWL